MAFDKDEVREFLLEEASNDDEFKDSILVFELEMIDEGVGAVRGEVIVEGETEGSGTLIMPLTEPRPPAWEGFEVEEKRAYGFLVNSQKETVSEKLRGFFNRSVNEGKVQDFLPV